MGEAAGPVRNREDAVEMRGAPGMDFGMDVGRALSDLGRGIGETGRRLGDIGMAFGRQMQETEDRLNATKAESIWRAKQSELRARMADNPGAYDQFGAWAADTDLAYEEEAKPFLEKMSKRSRELFDARMAGVREEAINDRKRIGYQARTAAAYNLFQDEFKEKALAGDREGCMALLNDHRGTLISEEEYQLKADKDYWALSQYGEAKRRIARGERHVADDLKETDSEGHYTNYKQMDEKFRRALIKEGELQDAKMDAAEVEEFVQRLQSGEEIDIEKEVEFLDENQAKAFREIYRKFQEKKASAQAKEQAQRERDRAREAEAKKKRELDATEYELMLFQFSPDAAERDKQYLQFKTMIFREYVNDPASVKRLMRQLDETYKAAVKPDGSYKKSAVYTMSMDYIDMSIKPSDFRTYANAGDLRRKENKESELASYKKLKVMVDEFIRTNPHVTWEQVKKFIDDSKDFIYRQRIQDLAPAWQVIKTRANTKLPR